MNEMKLLLPSLALIIGLHFSVALPAAEAQIPLKVQLEILRAEDELRFDKTLEKFLRHGDPAIRTRAALAAGRIGNEAAIMLLADILERDRSFGVRTMAAFALGEIESIKAADAIFRALKNHPANNGQTRSKREFAARLIEAAGKIAAANPGEKNSGELGEAILKRLKTERQKGSNRDRSTVLPGLTALLRAKPDGADAAAAEFLNDPDARIRADAANTLARLRSTAANKILRQLLEADHDAVARANAARALGAAGDVEAFDLLLAAAVDDPDLRVRVSAIRSLGTLKIEQVEKNTKAADVLFRHAERLFEKYRPHSSAASANAGSEKNEIPAEKNELLEIASALGRLVQGSERKDILDFLDDFRKEDNYRSAEIEIAMLRINPAEYIKTGDIFAANSQENSRGVIDWKTAESYRTALGEYAEISASGDNPQDGPIELRKMAEIKLAGFLETPIEGFGNVDADPATLAIPATLRAYARFKPAGLTGILLKYLNHPDVFVRAAASELLAEQALTEESVSALKTAFSKALETDSHDNDAQLAMLTALVKLDKNAANGSLNEALGAADYLVRRHAAALIRQNGLENEFPGYNAKVGWVKRHEAKANTRLGQVLNSNDDYRRALARRNGSVKAIVETAKGRFTIELLPEDAPLTVDNFIKLANSGYFNGLEVHRVVPNFVMQDGDPRGDGNGGPGWSIRCEINPEPYIRGTVGMALSGKDTGGSQWFITHSPQPHLDGGYTVFGRVNEAGMRIVDNITRGDKILSIRIIENKPTRNRRR